MAVTLNKLTDRKIKSLIKPGYHADGGNLYIRVKTSGAKSWAFRWKNNNKVRDIGLGGYPALSLKEARKLAEAHRATRANGGIPKRLAQYEEGKTFSEVVEQFLSIKESEWTNAKHKQQWRNTLKQYCKRIANKPISEIDRTDVLTVLSPIWEEKRETASRLRQRIERVLSFAESKGMRQGSNPAVWRGNLDNVLPKQRPLSRGHHKALPYAELPEFIERLRAHEGKAAKALELLILTACRTSEILNSTWAEFDLASKIWIIPPERMKMRKEHRIPLTESAVEVLRYMLQFKNSEYVFPGQKRGKPLSNMAMAELLKGMKLENATVHGFRSTFRDWAGDKTSEPREVIEQCLAHTIGNSSELAYRRSDAIEKRRRVLLQWEDYCYDNSKIVTLRA